MAGTFDGTDWSAVDTGAGENRRIKWFTQTYDENINANALRWGTLYNFRFDADSPPVSAMATIGLFKPGTPDSITAATLGPDMATTCTEDLDGDGDVNAFDLAILLGSWGPVPTPDPPDFDGDGDVDAFDLAILLGNWGPCP